MHTRFQDRRLWLGGGAAVAVLIVVIGWFFVIDPELSAAASTREEVESARVQNVVTQAKNDMLKAQNDTLAALRLNLADLLAALPSDDGLPEFTRQLSKQAGTSVDLSSIVIGATTPVAGAVTATGGIAATGSTAETGATPGAAVTPGASNGLVQTTVTVAADGLGSDLLAFLQKVQTGPRRVLVTDSHLAPSGDGIAGIKGHCTLSLTLTIFSAPKSPEEQAALEQLLSGK